MIIEAEDLKEGELPVNKIIHGDVLEVLKKFPSNSVDCIVTSPPYWSLRQYPGEANIIWGGDKNCEHEWENIETKRPNASGGRTEYAKEKLAIKGKENYQEFVDYHNRVTKSSFCKKCGAWYGQLGLEPTLDMYIEHLLQITAELKRVLKPTGVMFWNHGDSYSGNMGKRSGWSYISGLGNGKDGTAINFKAEYKLPQKCLCMQNFRLIMRMVDEQGWILRNIIIWCLAEDTKMFIRRGNKYLHIPIKDVKEEDFVLTIDRERNFKWVRIKNKFNNGKKPVFKIITKSGKEITCTGEHEFPVKTSRYYGKYLKLNFKKAKDLTTKDFLWVNYRMPEILPNGNQDDYNKGFVVGFFLAEGSYRKRKIGVYKDNEFSKYTQKRWGRLEKPKIVYDRVEFACGKKDLERGYLEYLKPYNVKIKNYEGNSLIVYSSDKNLLNLIRTFVEGERCDKKHFSQKIWNTSLQFIKGVVDGFLAGDGSLDEKNKRWRVRIKANKKLKEDLELACRLIGYEFRYEGMYDTNYGTKAMGFVIRKEIKRKTFGFMYADQIDKIEKVGEKEVYDIEIEPIYTSYCGKGKTDKPTKERKKAKWNNLYFLANGVWTHNSKPNHMPSSVKDRFTNAYEPVFMLVKKKKYWFDLDAVRVPHKSSTIERCKYPTAKFGGDPNNPLGRFGKGINSGSEGKIVELNPLGKNPGDFWNIPLSPKYLKGSGHSNRQGLNRPLDIVTIKAYKEYQQPIARFLKKHIKKEHKPILDEVFGKHRWRHWIRTDFSGACLPGVEDWQKLKEILGLEETPFDDMIYEVQKLNIPVFQSGKNPGDVWEISTQAFHDAHFAVFPEKLVEPMIKAGCPEYVCRKCGLPHLIVRSGGYANAFNIRVRDAKTKPEKWGMLYKASEKEIESYDEKEYVSPVKEKVVFSCDCNAGFEPGIVLDPFLGSGTTALVALKLGRRFIGIEIVKDYCNMAYKRIKPYLEMKRLDEFG